MRPAGLTIAPLYTCPSFHPPESHRYQLHLLLHVHGGRGPRSSSLHASARKAHSHGTPKPKALGTENKVTLKDGHQQEGADPPKCSRTSTVPAATRLPKPQLVLNDVQIRRTTGTEKTVKDEVKGLAPRSEMGAQSGLDPGRECRAAPPGHLTGARRRRRLDEGACSSRCLSGR